MKLMYFVSPYDLLNKRTRSPHPMTVEGTLVGIFVRMDKILYREFLVGVFVRMDKILNREFLVGIFVRMDKILYRELF